MKANHLTSGEASSFQGHSRNIPDGAFSRQGHVQDSCQFLTHNWPTWGSKQESLGRAARPSKQRTGGSTSSVRNRTPSHHQVRPSPLPTVPSCGHRTLRAEASLRPGTRTHKMAALCPPHLYSWGGKQIFSEILRLHRIQTWERQLSFSLAGSNL